MQTTAQDTLQLINQLSDERQKLWRAKWAIRKKPEYRERLKTLSSRIDLLWKQYRKEMAGSIRIHMPNPDFDYSDLANRNGSSKWRLDYDADPMPYSDADWIEEAERVEVKLIKGTVKKSAKVAKVGMAMPASAM